MNSSIIRGAFFAAFQREHTAGEEREGDVFDEAELPELFELPELSELPEREVSAKKRYSPITLLRGSRRPYSCPVPKRSPA
jgi:hypothetical protein